MKSRVWISKVVGVTALLFLITAGRPPATTGNSEPKDEFASPAGTVSSLNSLNSQTACDRCMLACCTEYERRRTEITNQFSAQCVQSDEFERAKCELDRFKAQSANYQAFVDCIDRCPGLEDITKCEEKCEDKRKDLHLFSVNKLAQNVRENCRGLRGQAETDCLVRQFITCIVTWS